MTPFQPRPQTDIEAEILRLTDELQQADPTNAERVSWWGGQLLALLWAMGAERGEAIEAMYQIWTERPPPVVYDEDD